MGAAVHRLRELDGFRGFLACLVVLVHAQVPGSLATFVLMDGFFATSAFVITLGLSQRRDLPLRDQLVTFYRRRVARIFPGYYITLAVGLVLAAFINLLAVRLGKALVYDLSNAIDYVLFIQHLPLYVSDAYEPVAILGHTWSLAIEEQFYLVSGFLLIVFNNPISRLLVGGASILLGVWFRTGGGDGSLFLFHADAFGYGVIAAQLFLNHQKQPRFDLQSMMALGFAVSFLLFWFNSDFHAAYMSWFGGAPFQVKFDWTGLTILSSFASGCLVLWLALSSHQKRSAFFRTAAMQYCGRISYALYLSHFILTDAGFRTGVFTAGSFRDALSIIVLSFSAAHFFTMLLERLQQDLNRPHRPTRQPY